jgi:hypothetical protein
MGRGRRRIEETRHAPDETDHHLQSEQSDRRAVDGGDLRGICDAAAAYGAWVLSDEIYRAPNSTAWRRRRSGAV